MCYARKPLCEGEGSELGCERLCQKEVAGSVLVLPSQSCLGLSISSIYFLCIVETILSAAGAFCWCRSSQCSCLLLLSHSGVGWGCNNCAQQACQPSFPGLPFSSRLILTTHFFRITL